MTQLNQSTANQPQITESPIHPAEQQALAADGKRKKIGAYNLFWGVAATIAVFCILEACARVLVFAFMPNEGPSQSFDRKFNLAKHPPRENRPSILFIGTSIGSYGIYADLIATRLSTRGYKLDVRNLCTIWSRPPERLFLLQEAVRSGAKPVLVVCDFDALDFSTYTQVRYRDTLDGRFLNSTTARASGSTPTSFKSALERALIDKCYLYTFRSFLHQFADTALQVALHPERRYDWFPFTESIRTAAGNSTCVNLISAGGWQPLCISIDPADLQNDYFFKFYGDTMGPASASWFSLSWNQPLIDYCAKEHIPLVFLWHPMYPLTKAQTADIETNHYETLADASQQLRSALSKIPNTYFWDFHNTDSDWMHYGDMLHQNPAGAVQLSDRVAQTLMSPPYVKLLEKARAGAGTQR